ncbi:hypothetical protein BTM25_33100 [Actinomadura rubteroloni]|uniref:Uncharacterized protein n=1 Tax=Actinomadura rubteroloni TaxID=1926885 RepID=A0A2P4UI22_9ACTN|nr:hypothetical protein [Actinomadura rubteroloni]POM24676.1 hypothetical protein BTM25_33100 [Actinomadura rubteroloni]
MSSSTRTSASASGPRHRSITFVGVLALAAAGLFSLAGPAQASSAITVSRATLAPGETITVDFAVTRDFASSREGMGFYAGSGPLGSLDSFATVASCDGPVAGSCTTLPGIGYVVPTGPVPVGTTVTGSLTLRVKPGTPAGSFTLRYQFDGEATTNGPTITIAERPADQIADLRALVDGFGLPNGLRTALDAKLRNALDAVDGNDTATACTALADFVDLADAQDGKKLTADQAGRLRASATRIRTDLDC